MNFINFSLTYWFICFFFFHPKWKKNIYPFLLRRENNKRVLFCLVDLGILVIELRVEQTRLKLQIGPVIFDRAHKHPMLWVHSRLGLYLNLPPIIGNKSTVWPLLVGPVGLTCHCWIPKSTRQNNSWNGLEGTQRNTSVGPKK